MVAQISRPEHVRGEVQKRFSHTYEIAVYKALNFKMRIDPSRNGMHSDCRQFIGSLKSVQTSSLLRVDLSLDKTVCFEVLNFTDLAVADQKSN